MGIEWIDEAIEKLKPFKLSTEHEDAILDMMLEQRTKAELEGYERGKEEMLHRFQSFLIKEGHRPWESS